MNWKNKKVLVTGAGGFIGSHLTEQLVNHGATVRAFLRYNSRSFEGFISTLAESIKNKIELFYGEVRELETIREAMKGVDVVFNLAALVGIPYSYQHPHEVFETNTMGILNIVSVAREQGIEKIVHTSTSEVYGSAIYVPIDEKHPLQPQSPYSASKIGADALALSFFHSFNLPVSIIRPFNSYGPRQSERAVIPTIIIQALMKNEVSLGNLETTRDFTFVEDTARGFIKIAESDKSIGEVINIGSGKDISIGELCKKIAGFVGKQVEIKNDSNRMRPEKSEVKRLRASIQKAKELTGWEPQIPLDDGLKRTIDYIKANKHLYDPNKYVV